MGARGQSLPAAVASPAADATLAGDGAGVMAAGRDVAEGPGRGDALPAMPGGLTAIVVTGAGAPALDLPTVVEGTGVREARCPGG